MNSRVVLAAVPSVFAFIGFLITALVDWPSGFGLVGFALVLQLWNLTFELQSRSSSRRSGGLRSRSTPETTTVTDRAPE